MDNLVLSWCCKYDKVSDLQKRGITPDFFVEDWATVANYIFRVKRENGRAPSIDVVKNRFPATAKELVESITEEDGKTLIVELMLRRRWMEQTQWVLDWEDQVQTYHDVEAGNELLRAALMAGQARDGQSNGLVDIFDISFSKHILRDQKRLRDDTLGIKSGLAAFDAHDRFLRGEVITNIARSGQGKSWLSLFFAAHALMQGLKVMLYPLEMSVEQSYYRLMTMLITMHFGWRQTILNSSLKMGGVSLKELRRYQEEFEERYGGRFLMANVANSMGSYNLDRIESEIESEQPDMAWIDYINLLQANTQRDAKGWEKIENLSGGIKQIAMRQDIVMGMSAQVNREGARSLVDEIQLPGLEHIAGGDTIGRDSDAVFSMAKKDNIIHWALIKRRDGAEIPHQKMSVDLNRGLFTQLGEEDGY